MNFHGIVNTDMLEGPDEPQVFWGVTASMEIVSGTHEPVSARTKGGFGPFKDKTELIECLRDRDFGLDVPEPLPYFGANAEHDRRKIKYFASRGW